MVVKKEKICFLLSGSPSTDLKGCSLEEACGVFFFLTVVIVSFPMWEPRCDKIKEMKLSVIFLILIPKIIFKEGIFSYLKGCSSVTSTSIYSG